MRRGLSSLLAVFAVTVLVGLALQPTTALAAGGRSRAQQSSPQITHNSSAHARGLSARQQTAAVPVVPGAGYDRAGGSRPVRALQHLLVRAGDTPGPVDGRYGPLTQRAVRRYQAAHGLQVDGIAGPRTVAALSARTEVLFPSAGYDRAGGSRSVRALQRLLVRAGDMPGPVDGRYGPLTQRAVRRYQAAHGLQADGIAGPETFIHLVPRASTNSRISATIHRRLRLVSVRSKPQPHPHTRTPSTLPTWLVLLGIVILGLLLVAASYRRERRVVHRSIRIPSPESGISVQTTQLVPRPQTGRRPEAEGGLTSMEAASPQVDQRDEGLDDGDGGNVAGAAAALRREDQGGGPRAAVNLGRLLELRDDLAGMEAAYRRALRHGADRAQLARAALLRRADERGDARAAVNLGRLLELRGDLVGADAAYRRAIQHGAAQAKLARAALLELQGRVPSNAGSWER
jgi:peptidoglycan hydrolase-like protein with peptidoglycan-binding domain